MSVFTATAAGQAASASQSSGAWPGWAKIGGAPASPVSAATNHVGAVSAFYTGANGHLYSATQQSGGVWPGFTDIGADAVITGTPKAIAYNNGLFTAFALGLSGNGTRYVQTKSQGVSGVWSSWEHIGDPLPSQPASGISVAKNSGGTLSAFYIGANDHLYSATRTGSGTWPGWADLGSGVRGEPTAIAENTGLFSAFAIGVDGNGTKYIQTKSQASTGVWSGWAHIGDPLPDQPKGDLAVAKNAYGTVSVFYIGAVTGHLYSSMRQPNGTWPGWADLTGSFSGGKFTGSPVAMAYDNGLFTAFARGTDNNIYSASQTAQGVWPSWVKIGNPSLNPGDTAEVDLVVNRMRAGDDAAAQTIANDLTATDLQTVKQRILVVAPSSGYFGGPNARIDTKSEADSFLAAFLAAESDASASALFDGLGPVDRAAVDNRLFETSPRPSPVRRPDTGQIYYAASNGWYFEAESRAVAIQAGWDVDAAPRVTAGYLGKLTAGAMVTAADIQPETTIDQAKLAQVDAVTNASQEQGLINAAAADPELARALLARAVTEVSNEGDAFSSNNTSGDLATGCRIRPVTQRTTLRPKYLNFKYAWIQVKVTDWCWKNSKLTSWHIASGSTWAAPPWCWNEPVAVDESLIVDQRRLAGLTGGISGFGKTGLCLPTVRTWRPSIHFEVGGAFRLYNNDSF